MNSTKKEKQRVLATAWAIVCDQTGILHTMALVPILYRDKIEAERAIRSSGDRCDVAVEVEIRVLSIEKSVKKARS